MALSRASASDLVTEVRRLIGQVDADLSTDLPNVRILDMMNRYMKGLTHKVSDFLRAEGGGIANGTISLSFWKQTWASTVTPAENTLVVTQGGSTVDFPDTMDSIDSLYDETNERMLEKAREVNKRHTMGRRLRDRSAGPPESYELLGWATSGSLWVRQATPSGSEFLDIDPEYDQIAILGTTVSILSPGDPMVEEFKTQETAMLGQLAMTAVQVN